MNSRDVPLNGDRARELAEEIEDPVVRELTKLALAVGEMHFLKSAGMTDQEYAARLPEAPFDMTFYVKAMLALFSQRSVIEKVLKGKSVFEASGWNVG